MLKNEIGNTYGRLTVVRRATEDEYSRGNGLPAMWLCQCTCGNTTFAAGSELRNGKRISCGCQSREKAIELARQLGNNNRKNLTNQRFGKLIALELVNINPATWKCKCDCGAYTNVRAGYLTSGHTRSCGCNMGNLNGMSKGEEKICNILKENHILFEREKTFDDLLSYSGTKLRFDFAVYNNLHQLVCLIEFQGQQHYKYIKIFSKTKEDFKKRQEYDRKKARYCLAHNIKLFAIPYTDIDSLKTWNDLTKDEYYVKSQYHNDIVAKSLKLY